MSTHESFWKAQIDATETLCHLLDEQGVEHKEAMPYVLFNAINRVTEVRLGNGRWFRAIEMQDHSLMLEINGCTPELAVEVALELGERGRDYHVEPSGSHDEVALFKAENAKLREQLRDVYVAHRYGLDCTECPWYDECDTEGGCPWLGILRDHLHELGIETD